MNIYRNEISVRSTDVDAYRRLRLSALFTWLQEAAIAHTTLLGAGRDKTLDKGLLWIVTQQQVKILRMPEYGEQLLHLDWPGKTMHVFFPRCSRFVDSHGETIMEASALWCLMDRENRSMVFPEDHGIRIEACPEEEPLPLPRRIRPVDMDRTSSFTVPFSYLDLNGHMSNIRYFDMVTDLLPETILRKPVREIQTEYRGEARLGDRMELAFRLEDSFLCLSAKTDKPVFRIRLDF